MIKNHKTGNKPGKKSVSSGNVSAQKPRADKLPAPDVSFIRMVEASLTTIFIFNLDHILYSNKAGCKLCGYSLNELKGMTFLDLIPDEDKTTVIERAQKRFRGKKVLQRYELRIKTKSGKIRWIDYSANNITFMGNPAVMGIAFDISERKRDKASLDHSNSLLLATLESTADGILVVDSLGKISGFNNTFKKMWKIPATILRKNDDDITINYVLDQLKHPEVFLDKVYHLYSHPDESSFDTLKFKDGRIYERYSLPQKMGNKIIGRVWSFRDVTRRRKAEIQRKLNEARLETLLELYSLSDKNYDEITDYSLEKAVKLTHSVIGFIAFLSNDESVISMHSWSEEVSKKCDVGEPPYSFMVDKNGLLGKSIRRKKPLIVNDYNKIPEESRRFPNGPVQLNRFISVPVIDSGRTVVLITVANKESNYDETDTRQLTLLFNGMWNIIQRKKIFEEIIESEKRYRIITDNSNDLITKCDTNLLFTYVSPASKTMLGYKPQELMGSSFASYIHPDDQDIFNRFIGSFNQSTNQSLIKYRFRKKNGGYAWLESNNSFLFHLNGEVKEIISVTRDLSEIVSAEKLIREKEEALMASKAKSEFLANISHEIRNPLNSIIGLSNNLSRKLTDTEYSKVVDSIKLSSGYLLNIINDVLDFSKIEAHQARVQQVNFYPALILRDVHLTFSDQAKSKGLDLRYQFDFPEDLRLSGDEGKLKQIIINLVSNAIKFTEYGEVAIITTLKPERNQKHILKVDITDSGIGIKRSDYHKLFQSFTQVDSSTTKSYPGTGLGLAIVKSYTDMLQGKVYFKSELNKGTVFTIEIPFKSALAERKVVVEKNFDYDAPVIKGLKILVAEDDAINQLYLKEFLTHSGHIVDTAFNGLDVLEKFASGQYDLILMDGQMPKMDGFSATKIIREKELSRGSHTPIIAITGYAVSGDEEKFLRAGMDAYISKPIDETKLLNLVARYGSKRSG